MTAKEMLVQESISAVEFCVKEDPLLLVGNLNELWKLNATKLKTDLMF